MEVSSLGQTALIDADRPWWFTQSLREQCPHVVSYHAFDIITVHAAIFQPA